MEMKNLFQNAVKNPLSVIFLVLLAVFMAYLMIGDIQGMQQANTDYEYYQNLCYLIDNIARTYFFGIYLILVFLIYINRQYSRWCIWLYYVLGASCLVYMAVAGYVLDYGFCNRVNVGDTKQAIRLAKTVFQGPLYSMIICYFLVPKFIKDTMKLKEEQDLTI